MRKPKIHSVKSDRFISLMVTTKTSSSGRSFRIPKVIFPLFMVLLLIVGFYIGSVYTNFTNQVNALEHDISYVQEQKKLVEEEKSSVEAVLSEKNVIINELLGSIEEKEAQLNILKGQTQEILSKIENLEAIRDSIFEKLNEAPEEIYSSETTASKTPNDVGNSSSALFSSSSSSYSSSLDNFDKQYSDILALLNSLETVLNENYKALNTLAEMTDAYVPYIESIPSGWPIKDSKITCPFGYRTNPITGKGKEFHYGIDFAAKYKQELYATASGTVTSSGYVSGYGYTIVIDHGYGYSTRYAHCTKLLFKKGDTVSKGDCVALAGRTGRSTAVHLHYEVMIDGVKVDPADYLD
ncbi:MAG: hypothetical protein E7261_11410 [Lachnospiraceae bacterium]|nr:hypothetical protein [Lachnospiraceae bacterium]